MPYYLVPMVPDAAPGPFGRTSNHPLSLDYGGNAVILDSTIAYGWTPAVIPDARATWICDDKNDIVTGQARAALQQLVPGRVMGARFKDIVGDMLKTPPAAPAAPHVWKPITPHSGRRQLEILLGPGEFLGTGVGNPGLLWSEPAEVGGPHSQNLTDTFNRANGALNGSTSSDGLFSWVGKIDAASVTIVSNQAHGVRAGADVYPTYVGSVEMDTADAYVWTDVSMSITGTYVGPWIRAKTGDNGAGDTGYWFLFDAGANTLKLYSVFESANVIGNVSAGGASSASLYIQFIGSTYVAQKNGVTVLSGTNGASAGAIGERKVGFTSQVATNNANIFDINNFYAADIAPASLALADGGIMFQRIRSSRMISA